MQVKVPRHALSFLASTAKLAGKYGLKKGAAKAAAKANPALLVLEAATSVADAVQAYLDLREARETRAGLKRLLPHEEERLRLAREQLSQEIVLAEQAIVSRTEVQRRLGALTLACAEALRITWDELHSIRSADLPELEAFDRKLEDLEDGWHDLQRALEHYSQCV